MKAVFPVGRQALLFILLFLICSMLTQCATSGVDMGGSMSVGGVVSDI